jgi:hypothetical protein
MKKISFLLVMFLFGTTLVINAQKVLVTKGDLSVLKGETQMNTKFKYDDMRVGKMTESEYLAKKMGEYDEKEPGRGEKWQKAWVSDREALFQPKFISLFNSNSKGLFLDNDTPAKYTLIFHTTWTEPGWWIYVSKKNAEISGVAYIVETANPDNVVAKVTVDFAPGRTFAGADWETGPRIAESYAVSGKRLGALVAKSRK